MWGLHRGLYEGAPGFGNYEVLEHRAALNYFFTSTLSLLFAFFTIFMGIYHLFLYWRLPSKRLNLLYCFFALASSYFMLSLGFKTIEWFSDLSLIMRLHALSAIITLFLLHAYTLSTTHRPAQKADKALAAANFAFLVAVLIPRTHHVIFLVFNAWYPLVVIGLIYLSVLVVQAKRHGRRDLTLLAVSMFVMLGTALSDIFYGLGLLPFVQISSVGFFALNLGIMFALAHDFTGAYLNVEEKVEVRTRELAVANDQLRALDKMKEKFFANVSHDFKTPLAVAFAHIEQVKEAVQGSAFEGLAAAERSLNKLQGMVGELLDTMRAESGQFKLKWETGRPGEILQLWLEPYHTLCAHKGLEFVIQNEVDRSVKVPMDIGQMERVLANLISNAIKFTSQGSVTVRAISDAANLRFEVIDTGPGISKQDREKIFDRYYQGFNTSLRDHGGSGIGLSFVKEVVELHHGCVWVEPADGIGSKFIVTLPVSQDVEITGEYKAVGERPRVESLRSDSDVPFPPSEPPRVDPHKASVLIVEDNAEIALTILNALREAFNVYFARHGQEALDLLEKTGMDGILTDLMMPVMDGTELLKRLRADPRFQGIPVVILSSKGEAEDVVSHLKLGAQDYVSKPFRKDVLLARLRAQIERRKLFERLLSADKMVTLGLLSSGISHEIRNPLGIAQSGVDGVEKLAAQFDDLLKAGENKDPKDVLAAFRERQERLTKFVQLSSRAMARIHRIVESMRGFASGSQQRVQIDIREALQEAITLVAGKAKKRRVEVSCDKGESLKILGYPTLNQVFVNLLDNAIDASPEGSGVVRVRFSSWDGGARVAVEDNGSGIAPDILPHIFDPFVTTKPPEQGTGLGLFIVKRIVELQHGGKIRVKSKLGNGALFEIELLAEAPVMDIEGFKPFHGIDLQLT
ncbi:MAG: sensor histidine kinase [Pseudomonadota bacterium]